MPEPVEGAGGQPDPAQGQAEERIERLVPLARDVVLVLVKTLKATGMYLPNNPIYKRFHEDLSQKFEAYFAEEDSLSLRVNRFELTFLGREVYQNPDKEANIALMFFKDGVRELSFHNGIDEAEIDGLMDLLKFNAEERALDDDLVTLMWEKDFRHITYTVVEDTASEENEVEEAILGFGDEPEALRQIEELRALAQKAAAASGGEAQGPAAAGAGGDVVYAAASAAKPMEEGGAAVDVSDAEDYESIRGTYQTPDDVSLLTELTDIFYEILITEPDMEKFRMVAESLSKALDIFVSRGDLALATVLVLKVQELADSDRLEGEAPAIIDKVLDRAASETLVVKVGQFIEETGQDALEAAGSYLSQLDDRALGPMVKLLETLSDRKARRVLCDIMQTVAGGSGAHLTPHLRHRIWYVARNVAMILGRTGDPDAVRPLAAALRHEEPRVRKEALAALNAIGSADVAGYMESALEDEARMVRSSAARVLAELDPERACARLVGIASGKGFKDRPFDEKKEMMELIGRTGKKAALEFLSAQFKRKGLLGGAALDESRAAAAYGLAAFGGPEAMELLRTEASAKGRRLRAACTEGIRMIETRRVQQ
jgi:HEAT repeats/PBS lyase HEAT-like repeat